MVLCQGVSVGNAQLLAFPGRSSSLKSTWFHIKTNHFPARALRGMKTANIFSFGSLQFRRYSFISVANSVFLLFCFYIFLIKPFWLIILVLDKISWSWFFSYELNVSSDTQRPPFKHRSLYASKQSIVLNYSTIRACCFCSNSIIIIVT